VMAWAATDKIEVYDLVGRRQESTDPVPGRSEQVRSLSFTPDGSIVVDRNGQPIACPTQAPPPNVLADAEATLVRGLAAVDYETKAQA